MHLMACSKGESQHGGAGGHRHLAGGSGQCLKLQRREPVQHHQHMVGAPKIGSDAARASHSPLAIRVDGAALNVDGRLKNLSPGVLNQLAACSWNAQMARLCLRCRHLVGLGAMR